MLQMSARDLGALVCLALIIGVVAGVVSIWLGWILRRLFRGTRATPTVASTLRVCVSNSEYRDGV